MVVVPTSVNMEKLKDGNIELFSLFVITNVFNEMKDKWLK